MDGRRFNRGAPSKDPPSSPHGADQDTLARLEKQLEIDEGARFYDWHGHALTGPERRAHLEAFRSNRPGSTSILPPPDSSNRRPPPEPESSNAEPWDAEPWNRQAPPQSDAPPPEVVETTALVPDAAVDPLASVDVDVDEFESDQRLFAIDSAAPVFALRPKAERPRRTGRPVLIGLFALCLLLVAVALAGLLRSDPDPAARHATASETPPATLVAPTGLSTETPSPAPRPVEVTPAPDLSAAALAGATPATTAAAAGAPAASAEPGVAAAKPAPPEPRAPAPPVHAQEEPRVAPPPSPPIQKPAPSPSPALPRSVVPNDTPKF